MALSADCVAFDDEAEGVVLVVDAVLEECPVGERPLAFHMRCVGVGDQGAPRGVMRGKAAAVREAAIVPIAVHDVCQVDLSVVEHRILGQFAALHLLHVDELCRLGANHAHLEGVEGEQVHLTWQPEGREKEKA